MTFRILPRLNQRNQHFWTSGRDGQLQLLRCQDCSQYIHPPQPICPRDQSKRLKPEAVSGLAQVATFTINHKEWMPGPAVPYVVAIVAMEEDPTVRLTTNIVNCAPDQVRIGMRVRVVFEHHSDPEGDVWLPLFEPAE